MGDNLSWGNRIHDNHEKSEAMTTPFSSLVEQLNHPDRNVRGQAALSLGSCGESGVLDALLGALATEPDPFVREDMTWAVVRIGDSAVQPVIDLLTHPDAGLRHQAAHILGKIRDSRAIDPLIAVLGDENPPVVLKAAFSLGQMAATQAIPALVALLGHPDSDVRTTLVKVLEGFGEASLPALLAMLTHPKWQAREQAVDIVGQIGDAQTLSSVVPLLTDERWEIRFSAVNAVAHLGNKASIAATLTPILHDPDSRVQSLAAEILARLKQPRKTKLPTI